jgi:hypothetical protein
MLPVATQAMAVFLLPNLKIFFIKIKYFSIFYILIMLKRGISFSFFLIFLSSFWYGKLCAQTIVTYTGMGSISCPATPMSTISAAPTGLTFSQLSRGSGVTCVTAATGIAGSGFNSTTAANAFISNKYHTISITSNVTTAFSVTKLVINSQVSAAGSGICTVMYNVNGGANTTVGTYTPTTTNLAYTFTPTTAIPVETGSVLNIYVVPSGYASNAVLRVNNLTNFTVCPVYVVPQASVTQSFCQDDVPISYSCNTLTGVTYQWYSKTTGFNGVGTNLGSASGAQTNTYTPSTNVPGTFYYTCITSSACGATASINIVKQEIKPTTAITEQPENHTFCLNLVPTGLVVMLTGADLTYQWFSNTSNSNTGGTSLGVAAGAQTSTYTPPTSTVGTTYYYCEIMGACGNVVSNVSEVIVITRPIANTCKIDDNCQLNEGQIMVNASGGTPSASGYLVHWADDFEDYGPVNTINGTYTITGLTGGMTYYITVLDSNGCSAE